MHINILTENQHQLLKFISIFRKYFYLVGGTAIALHIGHRRSIDYDLFSSKKLNKTLISRNVLRQKYNKHTIFNDTDQIHFIINKVKITFFYFPFPVPHNETFNKIISLPSLLSLAAMKAFTLGRRAKWKDYVDLYFILKLYYSINDISGEARKIFGELYSEKLFRQQLSFHDDIDFSEPVDFLHGFEVSELDIKSYLIQKSIEII